MFRYQLELAMQQMEQQLCMFTPGQEKEVMELQLKLKMLKLFAELEK